MLRLYSKRRRDSACSRSSTGIGLRDPFLQLLLQLHSSSRIIMITPTTIGNEDDSINQLQLDEWWVSPLRSQRYSFDCLHAITMTNTPTTRLLFKNAECRIKIHWFIHCFTLWLTGYWAFTAHQSHTTTSYTQQNILTNTDRPGSN